jgi:hypothetical protein
MVAALLIAAGATWLCLWRGRMRLAGVALVLPAWRWRPSAAAPTSWSSAPEPTWRCAMTTGLLVPVAARRVALCGGELAAAGRRQRHHEPRPPGGPAGPVPTTMPAGWTSRAIGWPICARGRRRGILPRRRHRDHRLSAARRLRAGAGAHRPLRRVAQWLLRHIHPRRRHPGDHGGRSPRLAPLDDVRPWRGGRPGRERRSRKSLSSESILRDARFARASEGSKPWRRQC